MCTEPSDWVRKKGDPYESIHKEFVNPANLGTEGLTLNLPRNSCCQAKRET
jgi:hypothetical protein